jgi:uncharacterized protein
MFLPVHCLAIIAGMSTLAVTPRTRLHRVPARGSYDRATIDAILDEGLVAHVGLVDGDGGQPFVMPMAYARLGAEVILHGARASRALSAAAGGAPLCVTVTLIDGLVLARSAFHHSMNYRSVVILGRARELTGREEKCAAMNALVNHVLPGRAAESRPANEKELGATRVVALPIDEASAKVRSGGPLDDEEDLVVPCWAGHLPLRLAPSGEAIPDPQGAAKERPLPRGLRQWRR